MCNTVVFEVLADLAKKKEGAYKKGTEGLPIVQEIETVEQHVKRMIKPRPIDQLIPRGDEPENGGPEDTEVTGPGIDLSKVGM